MSDFLHETLSLPTSSIGNRFAELRLVDPQSDRVILNSIRKYGQLTPVVVCCIAPDSYELLDGFKRLRACRSLGIPELTARLLKVGLRAAKAAILDLNSVGKAISSMEEALVVNSLCHEDGLSQVEIAAMLGRNKTWVCRRASLITRLCGEAQERIKLGLLPASLGTELARLQRCNQQQVLNSITLHHLTWREVRKVIDAIKDGPSSKWDQILRDPRAFFLQTNHKKTDFPIKSANGLGPQAMILWGKIKMLERICLDVLALFSRNELGPFKQEEKSKLRDGSLRTIVALEDAKKKLSEIMIQNEEKK